MTVYIEKPAVNLREELASLRNQGGYEERQFYFDNLVTNGAFDADTNWTKGTGWTISGGVATTATATAGTLEQTVTLVSGRAYRFEYTITGWVSGQAIPSFGGGTLVLGPLSGTGNGTRSVVMTAAAGNNTVRILKNSSSDAFSVDNVSIFETDGTDVVHRMPKGWVPLHVYEDGLLQREGAAHDYEVVYDGFDYYVKPAVAPGATTETCVIGVRK